MTAYYNEWDAQAAAWLRELIKQGHIADGEVDERDIKEVKPEDLRGFTQCHFFAGIGGWSVALRLAGWADDRPVWTGSPPCQPFSVAGRGKGIEDDRHIAPVWLDLVKECRPPILFGEQVAAATSKDGWLDSLQDALEAEGYATGAAVLPACSVNAPHIRQRLWFTGRLENTDTIGRGGRSQGYCGTQKDGQATQNQATRSGCISGLADTELRGCKCQSQQQPAGVQRKVVKKNTSRVTVGTHGSSVGGLADTTSVRHATTQDRGSIGAQQEKGRMLEFEGACSHGGLANANSPRLQGHGRFEQQHGEERREESIGLRTQGSNLSTADAPKTQWENPDWLWCRDGKWRPVESSTFPLAHGIPARVGRLRGYGNAIVPQVAAEVIQVMMEYCDD